MDLAPWFAFAGKAFLSPEAAELAALSRELENSDDAGGGWRETLIALRGALGGDPAELQREYVRLFLNPSGAPCPPWQSAYGEDPQLLGPAHRSALAWYRAAGVEPKNAAEPADHIGLLLAFFARLLATGSDAEILDAFSQEHLVWVGPYCESVERETRHNFYKFLAIATKKLVESVL